MLLLLIPLLPFAGFVINAFLLKLSSLVVPGFVVRGFISALLGSILITVLNEILRSLIR